MHELLEPGQPSRAQAVAACDRFLRTRWKRWRLAAATLPRDLRDDLIALFAWHGLLRRLAREEGGALDAMASELDAAVGGRPESALGNALLPTVRRHALPALLFLGPLEALRRAAHVHAFATRDELLERVKKTVHPEGRLLLKVLGADSERNQALADALGTGLQLASWIVHLREDLRRGYLNLPLEDLSRCGVELEQLRAERSDESLRALVAREIDWAREQLARGWPLCAELGRWRGRQLAFVLRWHAASLSGLEARRLEVMADPPPAGWLRLSACLAAGLLRLK